MKRVEKSFEFGQRLWLHCEVFDPSLMKVSSFNPRPDPDDLDPEFGWTGSLSAQLRVAAETKW